MVSVRQYQQLKGISKNFSCGLKDSVILVILLFFFTQICSAQINSPPYIPSSPTPSDGDQNQPVNLRLSWYGGDPDGDPVTYKIYIDTSPSFTTANARVFTVTSNTYYDIKVAYGTTYYWLVSASDGYYTENSPVWSFITQILPAPTTPAPTTPAPTTPAPTLTPPPITLTSIPTPTPALVAIAPTSTATPSITPTITPTSIPTISPSVTPTPTPISTPTPIPPTVASTMVLIQIVGVILVLAGLLFTALTTVKKDVIIEFGISERTMKYAGGAGIILIIIGVYILLKSAGLV